MALTFWRKALTVDAAALKGLRLLSSVPAPVENVANVANVEKRAERKRQSNVHAGFRFIYPEFLPDPDPRNRNYVREKLERLDMLKRRNVIDLPEFYVGSVLAVTVSNPHAETKSNRFVGICIEREKFGLKSEFTLRNVVDNQGIEVRYNLYDPTIQKLQVLRLEKRLDDRLHYLRDALPEYSTFDFDMEPEILPEGTPVPVNRLLVELKPRPWRERYDRQQLKGVAGIEKFLRPQDKKWLENKVYTRPWDKFDLMKQYRRTIPEEDQSAIWTEVYSKLHELEMRRKKISRKRVFNFPKKMA